MATDPADTDALKELRLALVCYGGVSLAVYMHGLAQELHRLVIASTPRKPAPKDRTQGIYRELLDALAAQDGVRTCVVVDIIAGTSAGGINGVSLARALAQDGELTPVRDLWLKHADITKLLREEYRRLAAHTLPTLQDVVPALAKLRLPDVEAPPRNLFARARDALRAAFTLRRDVAGVAGAGSVLHGDQLSYLIADGLRAISPNGTEATLMPKSHKLDLFVPMTDRYGYAQHVPLGNQYVTEMANRHFNTFTRDEHRNDFAADTADMLGFSGRATSSFPGAFEPISLETFASDVGNAPAPLGRPVVWPDTQINRFYRVYELRLAESMAATGSEEEKQEIRRRAFVDGGVLDNYPFDHAIDEIRRRPADRQTRRWLLYLEPDPMRRPDDELHARVEQPSIRTMLSALKAAGSDIPLQEPIREQIKRLEEMNDAARRLQDAIASTPLPTGAADVNTPAYVAYLSWRLETVKRGLAGAICRVRRFPPETNQATAVRVVVDRWVSEHYPLSTSRRGGLNPDAVGFLAQLDVGHERRRLRFLVDAVIERYPPQGKEASSGPPRQDLDAAKRLLYRGIAELDGALDAAGGHADIQRLLVGLFPDSISRELLGPPDDAQGIGTMTASKMDALVRGAELGEALGQVREHLEEGLGGRTTENHARAVFMELIDMAGGWGNEIVADLQARFEYFDQWDMALYPVRDAMGVGEYDIVGIGRMSPRDAWLLAPKEESEVRSFYEHKLQGTAFGHFGAFLEAGWRQNDYLWGRLDAAERLVRLVINDPQKEADVSRYCKRLFEAIVAEEEEHLPDAAETVKDVRERIGRM
jgi:patatin-related protein